MSQSSTETERTPTRTFDADAMKWASGIVSLIGLWIAASPFVYDTSDFSFWNNVAVGAAIFLIAGFTFYQLSNGLDASVGVLSLVVLLGL
jgi:predicted ABC-type sugar transport system permease subunit